MAESIMLEKAKGFAVNFVNLCKHIKEAMLTTLVALTLIPQQGQAYLRRLRFRGATPAESAPL